MQLSLLVMLGSALGGLARYWMGIAVERLLGPGFPWGTLMINVIGGLVIGAVGSATDQRTQAAFRALVMLGLCGGFTTFSAFSLQTLQLLQAGRLSAAIAYTGLSVGLCLVAVGGGWAVGRQWA